MIFALLENPYLPRVLFTHKRDVLAPSTIFSTSLMGIEKSRLSPNSEMKSRWLSLSSSFWKNLKFSAKNILWPKLDLWDFKLKVAFRRFGHSVWKDPKCLIWVFHFWHFTSIFVLQKSTCRVTLFDCKFQVFKMDNFRELLSTQNVNVARFARNVEYDFFLAIFKHCVDIYFCAKKIKLKSRKYFFFKKKKKCLNWDFFGDFQTLCSFCNVFYWFVTPIYHDIF